MAQPALFGTTSARRISRFRYDVASTRCGLKFRSEFKFFVLLVTIDIEPGKEALQIRNKTKFGMHVFMAHSEGCAVPSQPHHLHAEFRTLASS